MSDRRDAYRVDVYWEAGLADMYYRPIGVARDDRLDSWTVTPARLAELQAMPYREYLETPEWRFRRRQLIKACEYKCERCGAAGGELHVHHRTYDRLGDEPPEDLEVLCRGCHYREHHG